MEFDFKQWFGPDAKLVKSTGSIAYRFEPKQDITVYELAMIVKWTGGSLNDEIGMPRSAEDEIRQNLGAAFRHFQRVESEN